MTLTAMPPESAAVRQEIRRSRLVHAYAFVSKAGAYREFRRRFSDQLDVIATTPATQLPTSFRIDLVRGAQPGRFIRKLQAMPGVDEVKYTDPSDTMGQLLARLCKLRRDHPRLFDPEVIMSAAATAAQTTAVGQALRDSRLVVRSGTSRVDARREMRRLFADQPGLVAPPSALPASFRVELRHGATPKGAQDRLRAPPRRRQHRTHQRQRLPIADPAGQPPRRGVTAGGDTEALGDDLVHVGRGCVVVRRR